MVTEKRLIDAKALSEAVNGIGKDIKRPRAVELACLVLIADAPTIDAVEVVRCKDCRWRNTKGCPYKNFKAAERDDDDFCSDGERKDNDK